MICLAHDSLTHTIADGDTFWALSVKYNCTVEKIEAMNPGVEPTKLVIGQVIRLPAGGK
jgi:LysM repeat protein